MSPKSALQFKQVSLGEGWNHLLKQNTFVAENRPSISQEFLENLYDIKVTMEDAADPKIAMPQTTETD